jgi:urease accessory protein
VIVVDALPSGPPPAGSILDPLSLRWEDRARTRQRVVTRSGREVGIKLPTGTRLSPGTLVVVGDGWHAAVEAAEEDVWVVRARDRRSLLHVAWEIGSRHFPVELDEDGLAVLHDHTLAELWRRLGVDAVRARRPFLAEMRPHCHDEPKPR